MKQVSIIFLLFCALGSFAQNISVSSDKRVVLPALVVESVQAENSGTVRQSDAVPVTSDKYETSQQHNLLLVPVDHASVKTTGVTIEEAMIMSETATPLPASSSTTSQADKMILVPVNTQKP